MNYNDYKRMINAKRTNSFSEIKKLYEKYPDDERVIYLYAKILIKRGFYVTAIKLFKELVEVYSNDSAALELGRYYRSVRKYDLALRYLNSITNYKVIDFAIYEIAYINFSRGYYDEAEKNFKLLVSSNNAASALYQLARIEVIRGNYMNALDYLKKANTIEYNYYAVLLTGKVYVLLNNYLEAKETFMMLYGTSSDSYAKIEIVKLLIREENYDEAFTTICSISDRKGIANFEKMYAFLAKKTNAFSNDVDFTKLNYDYSLNQIIDYDEYLAFDKATEENISDYDFQIIKELLVPENKVEDLAFYDTYFITLNNVVYKVNTLPNSTDIMFISVVNREKRLTLSL